MFESTHSQRARSTERVRCGIRECFGAPNLVAFRRICLNWVFACEGYLLFPISAREDADSDACGLLYMDNGILKGNTRGS